jgi:hypothetical protein
MRILRHLLAALAALCALALFPVAASASLLIEIDKSAQTLTVSQDGARLYTWPVSTGTRAHDTPSGAFTPFRMEKDHFSREWDDAPMPNSIFFTKQGHAIHGTGHTRNIGRPASHGCVRLEPQNASVLFAMVKQEGMANTRVVLFGQTPGRNDLPAVARRAVPERRYYGGNDDEIVTGSVPQRRVQRGYSYDDRPIYWRRATGPSQFDDSDTRYRRAPPPPPPFYLGPRPRYGWD